jgi:hypothetical protein
MPLGLLVFVISGVPDASLPPTQGAGTKTSSPGVCDKFLFAWLHAQFDWNTTLRGVRG